MFSTPFRFAALALLLAKGAATLVAQIQLQATLEGELLPVLYWNEDHVYVAKDGQKRRSDNDRYEVRPSAQFGDGLLTISDVQVDLEPDRNAKAEDKARVGAIRFRYRAKVTADRPLSDCYALLTFVTEGSVGTRMIYLPRVNAGSPRAVSLEMPLRAEAVGTLHVFSKTLEIRSNLHPAAYDGAAYFDQLSRGAKGLSAAALTKGAEEYPYRLSDDGHFLAAVCRREAKKCLVVYDLLSMKPVFDQPVVDSIRRLDDLRWVSDHELVFISEDNDQRAHYEPNLYLLDLSTSKIEQRESDVLRIFHAVPTQPEILVLHRWDRHLGSWTGKYNVHTRKTYDIEDPDAGQYMYDRNGVARVKIRYDGDSILYYVRTKPGSRWQDLDKIVKQPGLHFNRKGSQILERVADIHSVAPDGDTLYVSTRLGTDRFQLDALSLSTGLIKGNIAKHPKYDLTDSDFGLTRLLHAKRSNQILGLVFEAQKPQIVWLDPRFAAVQKALDSQFPDLFNQPIDWTDDASTLIFKSASDHDPGTIYVLQTADHRLIPILYLSEYLKGQTLAAMTPFEFTARDGKKIPAYVTRPPSAPKGPSPLIVQIHGGPTDRDSWGFDPLAQFFASRGYIVLQVNYRGSSGYGAAFQLAGLRARLDTVVLDDIADGVRYLISTGEADPKRVGVVGASFGGWATYMSLIKYPDLYRAGVAISAISHWREAMSEERWYFDNKIGYAFLKSLVGQSDFAANEKLIDPYLRASELHQPIFIIHGGMDFTVSPRQSQTMLDALKTINPHVQSHSFPGASHTEWSFEDKVIRLNEMADFFERYLAPTDSAPAPAAPK